jgi:hypothetical protein
MSITQFCVVLHRQIARFFAAQPRVAGVPDVLVVRTDCAVEVSK